MWDIGVVIGFLVLGVILVVCSILLVGVCRSMYIE